MILLLLLVVVLVAAVGAGMLGVLSGDRRRERSGLLAVLSAPVVLVLGVVVVAVLAIGVRAGRSTSAPEPPRTEATQRLPSARVERATAHFPVVMMRPAEGERFSPYQPVSGLEPGSVVRVQAEGFDRFERGQIEQCVIELGRQTACSEPFPVQFDDEGRADVQFAVRGDVAPGGCRIGQPACLLRLTGKSSGPAGTVQTVLVDRLVPGQVRVEPARGLADGQTVDVSVTGFPAGNTAAAVLCAPPGTYDARRCTAPEPSSTFAIDAGGAGRTTLAVRAGRLGADAALCGPRRACGIAVVVGGGFVAAPVVPVAFSSGPGVAYDAERVIPGVLIAAVLVALAAVIAVRTDWATPTEAATPQLDVADLRADRDLDELFGTDEELDERDPIPW